MIKIPYLQAGDKVAIVATGRNISKERLQKGLDYLKIWNLEAILDPNLYNVYHFGYSYSGTKQKRLESLQTAMDDKEIRAIWFAAGGYGAVHLIDSLNFNRFFDSPKWIIGYSDITVFHSLFNQKQIPTIHANTVTPLKISYQKSTYQTLKSALFGEVLEYKIEPSPFNQNGEVYGVLLGGNLSILYSLLATKYTIQNEKFVLFIEDWYENWYHLDRMMNSLLLNGMLARVSGILVGSFTRMDVEGENVEFSIAYDSLSYQIIGDYTKNLDIPVAFGFPSGHISDNQAIFLGKKVLLSCHSDFVSLKYSE